MRCAFPITITEEERIERLKFFTEIFNINFLNKEVIESFIIYSSNPPNKKKYFFLLGHNLDIEAFLSSYKILEKNIIITSCFFNIDLKKLKHKNIYLCSPLEKWLLVPYYNGKDYGFKFNITDAELNMYNSKNLHLSDLNKIKAGYYKIN